jgi:cyclase
MTAKRIIARLDVKGDRLIKGIHLEGWRFLGDPNEYCRKYYLSGIDEIIYVDAVASLYSRGSIQEIIRRTTADVFVPITAGGGIKSVEDAYEILRSGADKVAINTAVIKRPDLITEIANRFGVQCMVVSIQAKKNKAGKYMVCYDSAREYTDLEVVDWAKEAVSRGAGEILLTSVDQEGTLKGMDLELIKLVSNSVNVPVIACGGFSKPKDFTDTVNAGADAVAIARALHYDHVSIEDIRTEALKSSILVRQE